jgi:hypothetical protein
MLPNLVDVEFGTVEGLKLEKRPRKKWACPSVKSLTVAQWTGRGVSRDLLHRGLRTYFPNSNLAKEEFDQGLSIFLPTV